MNPASGKIPPIKNYLRECLGKVQSKELALRDIVINTGFDDIDSSFEGFRPGELIVIAGRPSMGKSSVALNIVANQPTKNKTRIAYFCGNSTEQSVADRLIACKSRVHPPFFASKRHSEMEFSRIRLAARELKKQPIFIFGSMQIRELELIMLLLILKERNGLDLIVIDSLQDIYVKSLPDADVIDRQSILQELKKFAKILAIPIVVLSGITRELENRTSFRPTPQDMRKTIGSLSNIDRLLLVYRNEVYDEGSEEKGGLEIIIAKNNLGNVGSLRLFIDRALPCLTDCQDPRYSEAYT
jgi:replicative DNA helicase